MKNNISFYIVKKKQINNIIWYNISGYVNNCLKKKNKPAVYIFIKISLGNKEAYYVDSTAQLVSL